MSHISGADRAQSFLLPESIDQYVGAEHPVRAIDCFVEALDLQRLGFRKAKAADTGRPPYHPGDLLKLMIWGYLNRVRSSRRLELECQRNLEVIWLLRQLQPDFKTLCDFRRDNLPPLHAVFRQFVLLCRELGLYGRELVAVDGTRLKANNHIANTGSEEEIARRLTELDAQIATHLAALESNDQDLLGEAIPAASEGQLAQQLAKLRAQKEKLTAALEVALNNQRSVPLHDPQCQGVQKVGLGYNGQIAVDEKNHLIAVAEIADNPTDSNQLPMVAAQAQAALAAPQLQVVADRGYHDIEALAKTEELGVQCFVPRPERGDSASKGLFTKSQFLYEADKDAYRCPAGSLLERSGEPFSKHGGTWQAYANFPACRACAIRSQCTAGKVRRIDRSEFAPLMEEIAQRVAAHPELAKQRKRLVEHPFGTIKFWWNQGYFLLCGREAVRAEFALSALAYNFTRVLNLLGATKFRQLLEALRESSRRTSPRTKGGQTRAYFTTRALRKPSARKIRELLDSPAARSKFLPPLLHRVA